MKRLAALILGVCLAPLVAAQGKDSLWEISTRMEMPDMPPEMKGMKIPGFGGMQKQTVCLGEGKEYEPDEQKNCQVVDQKRSGRMTTVTVRCKDGTMKIEREELSKDHWRAKMQMTSTRRGQEGEMVMHQEAKKVGRCDSAQEGHMSRETQKVLGDAKVQADAQAGEVGKECQKAAAGWPVAPGVFATYDQMAKSRKDALAQAKGNKDALKMVDASTPDVPACAKAKVDYCAKGKAAFGEAGSRKGYAAVMKRGKPAEVSAALKYCGNDLAPVTARHCKAAAGEADYAFVGAYCPEERKVLAKQHCAGRSYTAVEPKYRALCGGGDGGDAAPAEGGEKSPAQGAKDAGSQAVEEGVKKLKGLFGF